MKTKVQEIKEWADLSSEVKTILERVDINRADLVLTIGEEVNIPYFKGVITEKMVHEISSYEQSEENKEALYKTSSEGDKLIIHFLKGAFE